MAKRGNLLLIPVVVAFSSERGFWREVRRFISRLGFFFFFFFGCGDQLAHTNSTLRACIGPSWLSELRRLWPSVPWIVCSLLYFSDTRLPIFVSETGSMPLLTPISVHFVRCMYCLKSQLASWWGSSPPHPHPRPILWLYYLLNVQAVAYKFQIGSLSVSVTSYITQNSGFWRTQWEKIHLQVL